MMRGIYILCEGQTEEEFINSVLRPYLNDQKIFDVRPILMSTSKGHKGGDVKYQRLKHHIDKLLSRERDIFVTTFIDFFRLKTDFPGFEGSKAIQDKIERVNFLEAALSEKINNSRFIPYIQLHEFEGLLFASKEGFEYIPDIPSSNLPVLMAAVNEKVNPELLNDGQLTAPSKRLESLIPGYDKNKPFYGGLIAEVNTIEVTLKRCDRFREWIEKIITALI